MIRVGELAEVALDLRKKLWLEKLSLPLQWRDITGDEKLEPESLIKKTDFDALIISPEYSDRLFQHAQRKPAEVVEVGFADSLVRQQNVNWLRCFLRAALKSLILKKAPALDTHSTCYVAGSGALVHMAGVVAIQLGFRRLVFISAEQERTIEDLQSLSKLYFDLQVHWLRESEMTLQPNNGSLLLNGLTPEDGGSIFEDLTYLNFLKKAGLVVDLPLSFNLNPLLEEAEHLGIRYLSGSSLWGVRDWLFLKSLLEDNFKLSVDEYVNEWESLGKTENKT